jgi:hypothetical protein
VFVFRATRIGCSGSTGRVLELSALSRPPARLLRCKRAKVSGSDFILSLRSTGAGMLLQRRAILALLMLIS